MLPFPRPHPVPLTRFLAFCLGFLCLPLPALAGVIFHFPLDGYQTVPATGSASLGECVAVIHEPLVGLDIACIHNVLYTQEVTIHRGEPGMNGPVVFGFATPYDPDGYWPLDVPGDLADLAHGRFYVQVTSDTYPAGEIRGTIRLVEPNDAEVLYVGLDGSQVVPAGPAPELGQCAVSLDIHSLDTVLLVCRHEVEAPTGAAIRLGGVGMTGPVQVDLGSGTSPIITFIDLTAPGRSELYTNLRQGNLYLEVRSDAHPEGEVRGQLSGCWAGPYTLCLQDRRFKAELTVYQPKPIILFAAHALPATPDSGMFYYFRPDNREMLLKVLDACSLNQRYWVFFAATTNQEFRLRLTDTKTGMVKEYLNPRNHAADTILDTDAFATCP